jgi:minor extracellular serine protease Vpr
MRFAPRGARRALTAAGLLLLASLTVVAGGSAAEPELSGTDGIGAVAWTPLGLRDGKATVIVKLAGDPVTVVQSKKGQKLSAAEKRSVRAELKSAQDALRDDIQKAGGTVLADFQLVYNGIKVRIDRQNVAALAALPNVVAVRPVQIMERDNVRGVPMIGAPGVWDGVAGLHGENIKVAVIDTGVDYTHANFGGPGTTAAFEEADAADTLDPNPAHGWGLRVKGGVDLVGDDYNASADDGDPALIPHPDPNPLDCNGHGSHVAGSAAGSGVLADGSTYTGPYNATTIEDHEWTIAPGVAPRADIYAVRVFGCAGSTDVTVDAIEWAVENGMDVINMSLGSSFGSNTDPSAEASTNAANAGVVVVTSAGNSGASQYITGSPGTADGAIATAALDPVPTFPGVGITAGSLTMDAINANGHEFSGPLTGNLKVIQDNPATAENEALGCSVAAYGGPNSLPPNTIAVVNRDTCARVAKAIFGQQAGAAAVIMVNNATGLPPFEGKITSNPDDGTPYEVTIPFLGVRGPYTSATSDGGKLRATADGTSMTLTPKLLTNPGFKQFASFSSGGPRNGDSALKPDITAPGVSIISTGVGTGNRAATISGTSMASPHVAGVAALTVQAHPDWSSADIKRAIVNTGEPGGFAAGYRTSRGGTGLVQPQRSVATSVVASATGSSPYEVAVNFGFSELSANFTGSETIEVKNNGSASATFNLSSTPGAAATTSPHSLNVSPSSITVPAGATGSFNVQLNVPASTVGASSPGLAFREVVGLIKLDATAGNNGIDLLVPYYLVPRALSKIDTTLGSTSKKGLPEGAPVNTTATVTNVGGTRAGSADLYAWGLSDADEATTSPADLRAVGVQTFDANSIGLPPGFAQPGERFLAFAVNTHHRWSTAAVTEFDIAVDVDRDKKADYIVVGVDQGAVQTGTFNGRMGAFVFSTRSPGASIVFLASDPTNSSTVLLPILSRQLCRTGEPCLAADKNILYSATGFDLITEEADPMAGTAEYDAFNAVVGEGGFASVNPGGTATVPISINVDRFNKVKPLGLLVASLDNAAGAAEAELIPITLK